MKYRIIESIYHNECGKEKNKHYYIQRQKTFLGIKYWSDVKHRECGWGDCHDLTTEFKSHTDAYDFVETVLCPQKKKNGWTDTVVNHFDC
jgi:hypothetical protein